MINLIHGVPPDWKLALPKCLAHLGGKSRMCDFVALESLIGCPHSIASARSLGLFNFRHDVKAVGDSARSRSHFNFRHDIGAVTHSAGRVLRKESKERPGHIKEC
jgi:hypothetical protein